MGAKGAPSAASKAATKPRPIHPHALKRRITPSILRKQSRDRRFLFIFNALTTFLFVGAAIGWGPMQLMMEKNGSYSEKCTEEEQLEGIVCEEQTSKLLKVGILIAGAQVVSPLLGWFVDRFGPTRTAYVQVTLTLTGYITTIISTSTQTSVLLYFGFGLIALASCFGSLMVIQLGLYFEGHSVSRVIFVLNTLFDSGTITYLALYWIQVATEFTTTAMLSGYLMLAVLLYGGAAYFWTVAVPSSSTKEVDTSYAPSTRFSRLETSLLKSYDLEERLKNNITQSVIGFSSRHLGNNFSALDTSKEGVNAPGRRSFNAPGRRSFNASGRRSSNASASEGFSAPGGGLEPVIENQKVVVTSDSTKPDYVLVADRDPKDQLTSAPFLWLCVFFALQDAMCDWNLATQRDFLKGLGDDDYGNLYLTIFTLMTPLSIPGAPFVDQAILHFGWTVSLQIINLLAIGYMTIKVASDNLNVQIVGFVIFSFYRSFLFGTTFSFLPTLVAAPVVGRAAGIMAGLAGVINLLQMPLVNLAMQHGGGNFFLPNVIYLCLTSFTTLAICMIGRYNGLETEAKERKEADLGRPASETTPLLSSFSTQLTSSSE